jgi:dTDP-4-amino-4,6-dideoxygalactose transaminase
MVVKIPFCKPVFNKEMEDATVNALRNERFVLGESVQKFEEAFAKYCGTDYAVSTSSGTNALHLALLASGVKKDQQVLTTPTSFIATANSILHAGATPIFCDIDDTYNLDPNKIIDRLTPKTKGIMPVHLYGYPCDMDGILDAANKFDLFVIEDACQAHGASYKGKKVGSLGDIGCFSFYSTKNMTVCGDGGMIVTNNESIAKEIEKLRTCGRATGNEMNVIGYTARLNTANAAIGIIQLKNLDEWNEKRRKNADIYINKLQNIGDIILPPKEVDVKSVYHLFVIKARHRDELKIWLESNGISCGIYYPIPIHLQPIYKKLYGYRGGEYPISEKHSEEVLSLPMFPDLTKEEIEYVCEKIEEFYDKKNIKS